MDDDKTTTTEETPEVVEVNVEDIEAAARLDAAIPALEAVLFSKWNEAAASYDSAIRSEEDEGAKRLLQAEKKEKEAEAKQAISQQVHNSRLWVDAVKQAAKESGVPVSILAKATSEEDVKTFIKHYSKPIKAAPAAVVEPAAAEEPVAPAEEVHVDSGVNTGGSGSDPWRTMSPMDKILLGIGKGRK